MRADPALLTYHPPRGGRLILIIVARGAVKVMEENLNHDHTLTLQGPAKYNVEYNFISIRVGMSTFISFCFLQFLVECITQVLPLNNKFRLSGIMLTSL